MWLYCLAVESEVISLLDPKDHAHSPSSTPANHIPGFLSRGGKIDCLNPPEQWSAHAHSWHNLIKY